MQTFGQMNLTDHGRQHVAVLQMEIVVRTIQIGRHDSDIVGSVLKIEAFAHLQTGNLGYGIRLVGIFQR